MFHDFRVHQEEMMQGMWGPWQAGETHESVFRGCSQQRCWRSSRTKGPCAFFQVCPGCIHVTITSVLIEINHNTCTRMILACSPWIGRKDLGVQSADLMMVRALALQLPVLILLMLLSSASFYNYGKCSQSRSQQCSRGDGRSGSQPKSGIWTPAQTQESGPCHESQDATALGLTLGICGLGSCCRPIS